MFIAISKLSDVSIYEQIYNEIKKNIIKEIIKDGEKLPSIRELAKELKVSVITTKRAYVELENDGYIKTYKGKGSYVEKQNKDKHIEDKKSELRNTLTGVVKESKVYGVSLEYLIKTIQELYGEE